jgi:hypothetical protein
MSHEDKIKMNLKGPGYKDALSINNWQPQLGQPCHYIECTSPTRIDGFIISGSSEERSKQFAAYYNRNSTLPQLLLRMVHVSQYNKHLCI